MTIIENANFSQNFLQKHFEKDQETKIEYNQETKIEYKHSICQGPL